MAWRVTELKASTLPVPALRVSALSAKVTQQASVTRLRISGISANATQQVVAPKLRVSGVSVRATQDVVAPRLRVTTLATVVTAAKTTIILPDVIVEAGSLVTSTFPEYAGAAYSATVDAALELRGSGRVRQFTAPPSIRETKYAVAWRAVTASGSAVQGTQLVTVLPCTVRVVSGGIEVPSYLSDG